MTLNTGAYKSTTYHDLRSDVESIKYGQELDLVAAYKVNSKYDFLVKFANYKADENASDTIKLWLQAVAKF